MDDVNLRKGMRLGKDHQSIKNGHYETERCHNQFGGLNNSFFPGHNRTLRVPRVVCLSCGFCWLIVVDCDRSSAKVARCRVDIIFDYGCGGHSEPNSTTPEIS
jgi:hypothetical protein